MAQANWLRNASPALADLGYQPAIHCWAVALPDEGYYAYGLRRRGGELGTENRFTSQKLDGVGLQYFNAR